jgi:eukaryotic-like serine/threonine-protein kinase
MDRARWDLVQSLFHQAADLSTAAQQEFLGSACGDDGTLSDEVRRMLEQDAHPASVLDRDLASAAGTIAGADAVAMAGQRFGPYRLVRVLGEGGAGVVYLGKRSDAGSIAAIKILRDAWLSPARRERFATEQRILARLNHSSIARLYDADTLPDGTPWFAMEYVEGVPLTDDCRSHAASLAERLALFLALCDVVQYAHRQMVVHRDLKPSNILVGSDGGVKLIDFGIAVQLDMVDPTAAGVRPMTPAYAAPEQMLGRAADVQTDVYALGAVLYELLADRPPFDVANCTPAEAERIIVETEPARVSLVGPSRRDVSRPALSDIDTLCVTAMHKDVQRRYVSVEALRRDVAHYLRCEPLEARPDSVRRRTEKFAGDGIVTPRLRVT